MTALKAAEIDAFVARPDPARPIALIFGPDAGLVHERAEAIIRKAVDDPQDPFSLARIDGDALAEEPCRLVEEAHTIPLFGGRRAVCKGWFAQFCRRRRGLDCGATGVRLPHRYRGRRSQAQRTPAHDLRAGQRSRPFPATPTASVILPG